MNGILLAAMLPMVAFADPTPEQKTSILMAAEEGLAAEAEREAAWISRGRFSKAGDAESELIYWTSARAAERRMKEAFDRAIRLAEPAYNLTPAAPPDPRAQKPSSPQGAWSAGLPAPWFPDFQVPRYRAIKGSDGAMHYASEDPDDAPEGAAALTAPDGKVTIFLSVMRLAVAYGEPGVLATAIHHETEHYRELVTTGWDTHEQGEIRANRANLARVDDFIPATSAYPREALKDFLRQRIAADERAVAEGLTHSPFPSRDQESEYRRRYRSQEAWERMYEDLVRRVEALRRERSEQVAAAKREIRWQGLRLWSLYACQYIDGVHQGDPEWGRPDLIRARENALRSHLRSRLVVVAKDEVDAGLRRGDLFRSGSIGICHKRVIEMIRDLPGPVDQDWVMDRIEYERRGGRAGEIISGVVEGVRRAVADGTAAIIETATVPFTGDRNSGRDSRREDRDTRIPDSDSLPWRQLRGISSRGW